MPNVPHQLADQQLRENFQHFVLQTGGLQNQISTLSDAVGDAMPVGSILAWTTDSAPVGWAIADGTAISRTTYAALFAEIGTTYGVGDGSTTFNLPNLKGRTVVAKDSAQTEFDALAETGGAKTHTLVAAEMPAHVHNIGPVGNPQLFTPAGAGNFVAASTGGAGTGLNPGTTSTGGGGAHANLQPYIVLNYIIKLLPSGDASLAVAAGSGLSSSAGQLNVNVDGATLEISADTLQVKDGGISAAKVAADVATQAELDAHAALTTAHAAATNLLHTTGAESKTGILTMANQLLGAAGSLSTVGVAVGEAGVGMYRFTVGRGALAAGGVRVADWQSTQFAINVPLLATYLGLGSGVPVDGAIEMTATTVLDADWTSGNTFTVNPGDGALFSGYAAPYPVKVGASSVKVWVTARSSDTFTVNTAPTTAAISGTSPYGTGAAMPSFSAGDAVTICLTDGYMIPAAGASLAAVFNQSVTPTMWLPPTSTVHSLSAPATGRVFVFADFSGNAAVVPIDIGIYNLDSAYHQINTNYGSLTVVYNAASQKYVKIANT